ncbi:patatin-like phospholipase family protein [Paractinoplanes durhamensis]|uniref:patatin-like phospholipase family protein n=1 Tax=Paractinoplanes durhamensis TaxID=113563 RepID=UPI00363BF020
MSRVKRIGLVLGAGGTLGAAWTIGGLSAVQDRIGRPLNEVDVIVGTSAGSIVAAAIRHGFTPEDLVAHQLGGGADHLPGAHEFEHDSGRLPPPPRLRVGSVRLLATAALAPHSVHPAVWASALLPQGRSEHHTLRRYVQTLVRDDPDHWPVRDTWIVGVDYECGRRTVFGRPGSPPASLPDAVVASCSIPGWHRPTRIGDRRYVDGESARRRPLTCCTPAGSTRFTFWRRWRAGRATAGGIRPGMPSGRRARSSTRNWSGSGAKWSAEAPGSRCSRPAGRTCPRSGST